MSGNYPPGTGPGDPNAPWNAPEPPECPDCDHLIPEGGEDEHAEGCPMGDLDGEDLVEYREEQAAPSWDDVKEERALEERGGR